MEEWFADNSLMPLGLMIVDARHKPTADDCTMAEFFKNSGRPFAVVANKLDKLRKTKSTLVTIPRLNCPTLILPIQNPAAIVRKIASPCWELRWTLERRKGKFLFPRSGWWWTR